MLLKVVHADHLGTPRAITRPSDNALVWKWDSVEPFGNNPANENPSGLGTFQMNLRHPGQYYDQEVGTFYNYFRDYDPTTGRYRQSDPIGLNGGINTFAYVGGNPLAFSDPLGLFRRGEGCSASQWKKIRQAEERLRKLIRKSCENCDKGKGACLPCEDANKLLLYVDIARIDCSNDNNLSYIYKGTRYEGAKFCGAQLGIGMVVTADGINGACNCLESTMMHEMLHISGYSGTREGHQQIDQILSRCRVCSVR